MSSKKIRHVYVLYSFASFAYFGLGMEGFVRGCVKFSQILNEPDLHKLIEESLNDYNIKYGTILTLIDPYNELFIIPIQKGVDCVGYIMTLALTYRKM